MVLEKLVICDFNVNYCDCEKEFAKKKSQYQDQTKCEMELY